MLADLRNVPCVEVVLDPELALVLKAFASGFRRGMDAPFIGGESSMPSSSFARRLMIRSHVDLVVNGQTGVLFLLLAEGAWSANFLDIS